MNLISHRGVMEGVGDSLSDLGVRCRPVRARYIQEFHVALGPWEDSITSKSGGNLLDPVTECDQVGCGSDIIGGE